MPLHPQEIEASDKHFAHTHIHTHEHTYSHGCGFMTSSHSHFCPYLLKSGEKKTDRSLDERVWVKNGKTPKLKVHKRTKRSQVLQQLSARTLGCVLGQSRHTEDQTGSAVGFGAYTWFSFQFFEVYCAMWLLLLLLESILQVFLFFYLMKTWILGGSQLVKHQLRLQFEFGHLIDVIDNQINLQVLFWKVLGFFVYGWAQQHLLLRYRQCC